jgi:hypothetical protein
MKYEVGMKKEALEKHRFTTVCRSCFLLLTSYFILHLLAGCGAAGGVSATPAPAQPPEASFSGTLEAADWTKTGESYCQGGSDYYVLIDGAERYPLDSERDQPYAGQHASERAALRSRLAPLAGRRVTLRGALIEHAFAQAEHCPDPAAQCPSGPITCRWIRVAALEP